MSEHEAHQKKILKVTRAVILVCLLALCFSIVVGLALVWMDSAMAGAAATAMVALIIIAVCGIVRAEVASR